MAGYEFIIFTLAVAIVATVAVSGLVVLVSPYFAATGKKDHMSFQIVREGTPEENKAEYRADPDGVYVVSCAGCGSLITIKKPENGRAWVTCPQRNEDSPRSCGRVDNCAFVSKTSEG